MPDPMPVPMPEPTTPCPACGEAADLCARCARCCGDCCECGHCEYCAEPCECRCDRCGGGECCCECSHCGRCAEAMSPDDVCSNCDRGTGCCCNCNHCDNCGAAGSVCGDCGQCPDCCNGHSNVEFFNGPMAPLPGEGRTIGLELEFSGMDDPTPLVESVRRIGGSIVEDGSLPSGGFEVNLPPIPMGELERYLSMLHDQLDSGNAHVTQACGVHVHVGAKDLRLRQVRRVLGVYSACESEMFGLVGKSRRKNHYCEACAWKAGLIYLLHPHRLFRSDLFSWLYGTDTHYGYGRLHREVRRCMARQKPSCRYSALNVHSWFHRRTFEFRHHHGTKHMDHVYEWAKVCAAIVESAKAPAPVLSPWGQGERCDGLVVPQPLLPVPLAELCPSQVVWLAKRRRLFAEA